MSNGAKAILPRGNGFSSAQYTYNPYYDLYSVIVILEEDLSKIVEERDRPRLIEQVRLLKGELKSYGGSRMRRTTRKNKGGANCKIGVLFPRFGGRRRHTVKPVNVAENLLNVVGGGCGCGYKPMMALPPGVTQGPLTLGLMKGGAPDCGCGAAPPKPPAWSELLRGGACPCLNVPKIPTPLRGGYSATQRDHVNYTPKGGYRATKRDLKYLKLWKQGKSIGFTMRSSLKAKGLIPRANGTKRVSKKYSR
jgi:hypothetical protein